MQSQSSVNGEGAGERERPQGMEAGFATPRDIVTAHQMTPALRAHARANGNGSGSGLGVPGTVRSYVASYSGSFVSRAG